MANIQRKRPRGGNRWLAVAGYGGLGLGCLLLAAITFLILAAPVELVRDRLVQEVKSRTGRDLMVSGPASLVLFPKLAIALGDVSLSPPPGMGGDPTLRVETLKAELSLMSLLSLQAGVGRLVLSRPVLELRVDAQGRRSWDVAAEPHRAAPEHAARGDARPLLPQQGSQARRSAGGDQLAATLEKLAPLSVSIVDGSLRYVDERAGSRHEFASLGLSLVLNQADGPLEAKGDFVWQGEKMELQGVLTPLQALLREQEARFAVKLVGRPVEANYEGTLRLASGVDLEGTVSVKSPSVQALAGWLGRPVALAQDPGPLNLTSRLSAGRGASSFSQLSATLGDTSLRGALKIETTGTRPRVSGNLQVSELDFGRILVRAASPSSAPPTAKPQSDPAELPAAKNAPATRGFTKRDGGGADWSDGIIDFAPLGLADADLALSADRIIHKDLKIGPSRLALKLDDKIAKIALEDMQLYGGRGRGVMTLDGSGRVPVTQANLTLEGVSAHPLLKDALGFDWLEGRSTIIIALASQGVSERGMVERLSGKVEMATANGAIRGFDIDRLMRNVEQGRFGDLGVSAAEKTTFSEFASSYTIANGIARNSDLRLVGPQLHVTGEGTVDLAQRRLDYTVNPKLAGGATTPGAVINVKNIEIPVRIEGSWDKPTFSVKGQEQIMETVRQIGKSIKSKDVEEALKGLFGGGDGQRVKPRDLIEKFLKKQ